MTLPRPACGRPPSGRLRWGILLCVVTLGCEAREVEPTVEPFQEATVVIEQEPAPEPAQRPFLPDAVGRSSQPGSFPHDAHEQIDCAACHETPRGHTTHSAVACADCHRSSEDVSMAALTPEECQACHHAAEQAVSCETCHVAQPVLTSVQQIDLEVWDAPRTRTLAFEHALHGELSCESCHQALPALAPAESCASCHAEHHTAQVQCSACHLEPRAEAHDVEAHLTCSGSGCHRAPAIERIATARAVCLSCHVDQQDHEEDGDCVECHRVRGEPVASAAWRHR